MINRLVVPSLPVILSRPRKHCSRVVVLKVGAYHTPTYLVVLSLRGVPLLPSLLGVVRKGYPHKQCSHLLVLGLSKQPSKRQ